MVGLSVGAAGLVHDLKAENGRQFRMPILDFILESTVVEVNWQYNILSSNLFLKLRQRRGFFILKNNVTLLR